ncbi:MAG TPA: hypothetical protein PLU73_13150 [Bacteroidia bacterium]|nr:hypothetical protein [Bacteroidia bacterium]
MKGAGHIFILLLVLFGTTCTERENNVDTNSSTRINDLIDSLGKEQTIATFKEEKSFSIIYFSNKEMKICNKVSYLPGYPLFSDSMVYKNEKEFYSPRLFSTYIIKDSIVICIKQVPIFHPNSNLRGQTPWKQPYVNSYARIDQ